MKKILIIHVVIFVFSISILKSQSFIKYDRFYLNDFEYNPAIAGLENKLAVFFSAKKSWLGVKNSPSTQSLLIHTNTSKIGFNNPKDFISNKSKKIGLGLSLYNDKNGPLSTLKLQLSYAYHVYIYKNIKLSLGLSTQLSQYSLNQEMLILRDKNDPLTRQHENYFTPNFNAGLWLNNNKFHFGFSILDLADFSKITNNIYNKDIRTYYFSSGYKFKIDKNFKLESNVLLCADTYKKINLNSIIKIHYSNYFWIGIGYSVSKSYIIYSAFKFKNVNFGYSFDYSSSPVYSISAGNHMVFISCNF